MRKRIPTKFGLAVLYKLMESGTTQSELIERVRVETGQYLDSGYLYKILTGQRNAPKIVQAIRDILELPDVTAS